MARTLHERFSGPFVKVVLGIIGVIFGGFFGIQQYFNPRSETYVATVNGHEISQDEFRDRYNNYRAQTQRMMGAQFDAQSFDTPERKRELLDQMVNEQLLLQANDKLGVVVPVSAIQEEIMGIPAFQVDGKFSPDQYRLLLAAQRKSPEEFESSVSQDIALRQLTSQIAMSSLVSAADVDTYLRLRDQTRDFWFVKLPKPDAGAPIADADIAAYYKAHADQYMTPEEVSLDYVELDAAKMPEVAKPDDAALKQMYDEQKSKFVSAEQREASHILIAVGKNADAAAQKAALAKAEGIEKELKAGKDFATLAKADSDDLGSKAQGGDLGWLEKGVTDPAFEAALFAMKKGDVSDPVKSDDGYHIIWLRDVHPQAVRTFDDVKNELAKKYVDEQREHQFSDVSGKLTDAIYQDPTSLAPAAKALGLTVQKTALFSRLGGAGIAANPAVVKAAFSNNVLAEGNTSDPIELGTDHIVVARVDQHVKPEPKPLDSVREQIRATLTEQQVAKTAKERAEAMLDRLRKGEALDKVAAELKLAPVEEKGIGRAAANLEKPLVDAVFAMPPPATGKTEPGMVALNGDVYALFQLDAVKDGDPSKLDPRTREAAMNQLRQGVGYEAMTGFLDSLRKAAKIEIAENRLN
ncbi:MAG: SurA N-terminal domain-containing protein [Proteobacteria bacterium]|nr:SurA N-terminal domain-containing protein [Pseudomonadota bacterium]